MDFKDYYAALGVERTATQAEIKRAYRKLARQFHPDVSKEPDAEARFKEVAEAHEALIDPQRRAAYDEIAQRHARGGRFEPPPGWDSGFEFSGRGDEAPSRGDAADFSAFFESLFGRGGPRGAEPGGDRHAKVDIDLLDAYRGARRTIVLHVPSTGADGRSVLHDRHLELDIPKGVREGQHLRLAGQGAAGHGGAAAGDLYLEVRLRPHPLFHVDGRDVRFDLPVAPWEAALGASVTAPTPEGPVQLTIPPGSPPGRTLRLKGKGLPGTPPGDLHAVLVLALPTPATDAQREAYAVLARAFPGFDARADLEA